MAIVVASCASERTLPTRTVSSCACAPKATSASAAQSRVRPNMALSASLQLAVLVLERERRQLRGRLVHVRCLHQTLERERARAHLVLEVPGLHVEHAVGVDRAVWAACRPWILIQKLRP